MFMFTMSTRFNCSILLCRLNVPPPELFFSVRAKVPTHLAWKGICHLSLQYGTFAPTVFFQGTLLVIVCINKRLRKLCLFDLMTLAAAAKQAMH